MKFMPAVLILIAPAFAAAQPANNDTKPCPLSHWSTTGAACEYAPDQTPAVDAEFKQGVQRSYYNDSLTHFPHAYNSIVPDGWVAPTPWPEDSLFKYSIQRDTSI